MVHCFSVQWCFAIANRYGITHCYCVLNYLFFSIYRPTLFLPLRHTISTISFLPVRQKHRGNGLLEIAAGRVPLPMPAHRQMQNGPTNQGFLSARFFCFRYISYSAAAGMVIFSILALRQSALKSATFFCRLLYSFFSGCHCAFSSARRCF